MSEFEEMLGEREYCRNCGKYVRGRHEKNVIGTYYLCPTCMKLDVDELAAKFEAEAAAVLAEVKAKYAGVK
jgi:hypothetical protein